MTDPDFIERLAESVKRHRRVLNWLEPHLGCVVCGRQLIWGCCAECDPKDE